MTPQERHYARLGWAQRQPEPLPRRASAWWALALVAVLASYLGAAATTAIQQHAAEAAQSSEGASQ